MHRRRLNALAALGIALLLATCNRDRIPTSPVQPPAGATPLVASPAGAPALLIGAGDIARCDGTKDEATALVLDAYPAATVFTAGDNIRGNASLADFTSCYGPSWGRHKARTRPSPGDNDYKTSGAAGYFSYFGAPAGDPGKGYYAYDLGAWHVMVLNSGIAMDAGSAQEQWLRAELAANTKRCTLAYWHYPRFSSTGTGVRAAVKPLWSALYDYGADVVVNAHYKVYERFAPQTPDGGADPTKGLRQFTVGTGGQGVEKFGTPRANSEARSSGTYGVLKLTLDSAGYAWAFLPIAGQTFGDTGSAACHTRIAVASVEVSPPSAGGQVGATVQLTATPQDAAGNPLAGRTITWQSADPAVAGVDAGGLVTLQAVGGPVTITATSEGKSGAAAVTVTAVTRVAVASVDVTPATAAIQAGATLQLSATPKDASGNRLDGRVVTWASGAPAVAAVDTAGFVVGLAAGSAAITATSEGVAGTSVVTVQTPTGPAVLVGAGDIASCTRTTQEATAKLLDAIPGTVYTVGDNAYPDGSAADYSNCYDPSWGRHKPRTRPATGNHEYQTPGATGYFGYFGAAAGDPSKGYYSYDLGDWHVVVINSSLDHDPGTPQEQWLRADLAAHPRTCTLAYWHYPRFSSGTQMDTSMQSIWQALYDYDADVVLSGHDHFYERFAPQAPDGTADPARGIREFVVGTGGNGLYLFGTTMPNSEVRNNETYGVLKLTLWATSYDWEFVPVAGATFHDQGSGLCHSGGGIPNQAPTASPGGPYNSEGTVTLDGSLSRDPDNDTPLSYAWDLGDGTSGSGVTVTHSYAAAGTYVVTLRVTDAKGATSAPAGTLVTIANVAPVVDAGPDQSTLPGRTLKVQAAFSDAGAGDSPWSYTIAWGDGATKGGSKTDQTSGIAETHVYTAPGRYTARVTVTDRDGGAGWDELVVKVLDPATAQILAGAGQVARCDYTNDEATAQLLDNISGTVFTTGDNIHASGSLDDYTTCYGPSWGRHKARTRPSAGNDDYLTAGASGYFDYFGAAAGDRDKGYYSYDLGDWHIVVLNSNIDMSAGSAQEQWLRADLAASAKLCTLAYWHHPRFSSYATSVRSSVKPLWDDLYAARAEVVLNGHYRLYERFAPQTPDEVADPQNGVRQFTVGTGGHGIDTFGTPIANSEVRISGTYGVLKLTLGPDSYVWEFVPVAGASLTDSGSGDCR